MSKNHAIRIAILTLAGLLASLIYTLAVGLLTVQAIGARDGAAFDLTNTVVAITEPHLPYIQMIAIALMGLLVAYVLLFGTRKQQLLDRLAMSGGFSVGTAVLVVYSFVGLEVSRANISVVEAGLAGWKGWIYKAGSDSSVHFLLALILGWMLIQVVQASRTSQLAEAKSIQ
ncbi:hypothetical protein [Arthrobacter rhombi]|uniref:hypothetical protein n=1 Tax=Arthrobacter rhombi TaxID=71253 RepID=UPI003FD6B197